MKVNILLIKKRVKSYFEIFFYQQKENKIDEQVLNNWEKGNFNKPDIIIFSVISYKFRFQRPQQIALHLAKLGHRVFYIENEFNPTWINNETAPITVKKLDNNLFSVKLCSNRNYFIYGEKVNKIGLSIKLSSYRNLLQKAKIENPIILVQHPFWFELVNNIKKENGNLIIYDCFDDHSQFYHAGNYVKNQEIKLIKISDKVIVSSESLKKRIEKLKSKKTILIKNGAETNKLTKYRVNQIPEKIKNIDKPIIGYHGAIEEWIDEALIEKILINFTDYALVMVGKVNNKKISDLLKKYKNLYLLGEINYEKIFDYIASFKIAIIPFLITPLIKATLPVKFFEYLALGKAVVSTNLPELSKYNSFFYIAKNHKEFIENISLALNENNPKIIKDRQILSIKYDWGIAAEKYAKEILSLYK